MKKQKVDLRGIETAVVTVGEGRGFIVDALDQRLVITAAHCLPHLPSAPPGSWEETYHDLIGPLNGSKPKVSVECLFVDPISDIAVLGCPDDQSLFDEAEAYEALVAEATALRISSPPEQAPAWLLTLDGRWSRCLVKHHGSRRGQGFALGALWIEDATEGIHGGMSGSPIVAEDATAIGLVSRAGGTGDFFTEGGPNPQLTYSLPGWLLKDCGR